jgi:hypothetical protein
MIENYENVKTPDHLSDKELFIKIWTSPRAVFRFINFYKYQKHVTLLLILAGIARTFNRTLMKNAGDNLSIWGIILFSIIIGALFGWIIYYIYAALISCTGKWLNAKGSTNAILIVLSYALIPSIVAMLFLLPQLVLYGNEVFKLNENSSDGGITKNIIVNGSFFLEAVLGIWTLVLCVIGIAEVQKLSIMKSILNLFLPAIVFLIPIMLFVLLIYGIN